MREANDEPTWHAAAHALRITTSSALAHIRGTARCALRALESPAGARDLESMAQVLAAIAATAEHSACMVDSLSNELGIGHCDEARQRRLKARGASLGIKRQGGEA